MHLWIIGLLCRSYVSVGSTHDCLKIDSNIWTSLLFCSCVPFTCALKFIWFTGCIAGDTFHLICLKSEMFGHFFSPLYHLKRQLHVDTVKQLLTTFMKILHNFSFVSIFLIYLFSLSAMVHWESGFFNRVLLLFHSASILLLTMTKLWN